MNRKVFQDLARQRIRDARVLLGAACPVAAYYLAGYAVECALKACIARKTRRHDFPSRQKPDTTPYTHDLSQLIKVVGLQEELKKELQGRAAFKINWTIVKDWNEESRYDLTITVEKARDLYEAITRREGVLSWVRRYW